MAVLIRPMSPAVAKTLFYRTSIAMVTHLQVWYVTSLYAYATGALGLKVRAEKFVCENFQFSSMHHNQEDCDDDSVISDANVAKIDNA